MGLDQRKRQLNASSERIKLIIERHAKVREEVHQLMLMYSVDPFCDSLDDGTMAAQITNNWTLTMEQRN